MIRIFCDRCGKEITKCKSHGYIALNTRDVKESSLAEDNEFENNQYCSSCMKQIREFIKAKPEVVVQDLDQELVQDDKCDQNDEKYDQNGKKCTENGEKCTDDDKKRIDKGKIIALKKAGWSNKDIAAEMHLEAQTVANVVYQFKKKSSADASTIMKPIQKQERPKL
ncbi:MAG: helix-turn-helix domain containing protein [Hespellia sp.]|nr:helix-turn-helix domain containing protein [Hespellia sp.]